MKSLLGAPLIAISGLLLSSCGILGGGGKASLYRLSANPAPTAQGGSGRTPIVVIRPVLPPGAATDRILTLDRNSASYVAKARWIAPADAMIKDMLAQQINGTSSGFRAVEGNGGRFILATRCTDFAAYYDGGPKAPPHVRVSCEFELRTVGVSEATASTVLNAEAIVGEDRVSSIVSAFDAATRQISSDLIAWLDARAR
ncbi:MAG: ABC-type transport auxiliary lipoprotein family protein [Sphingomonas sp.]|uniref:ABC-type transport auxiliary lipoprotein family protein n=1 Tax=Sphingomonas sp. TaxID=28214 RepID=UPI0026068244|nr:ABC-type transport auxiliary lipoprotein family protein [Sphingomonas sp.]MDK2768128.1 ABC-type transport auxiliary lipoprotein family protein [Sphingomonas sp.]